MYERMEAVVKGKVQGVMFRDFVYRKARSLALQGKVENVSDGTVLVIAEGPREILDTLVKHLHIGSLHSTVEEVVVEWYPISYEFKSFEIFE